MWDDEHLCGFKIIIKLHFYMGRVQQTPVGCLAAGHSDPGHCASRDLVFFFLRCNAARPLAVSRASDLLARRTTLPIGPTPILRLSILITPMLLPGWIGVGPTRRVVRRTSRSEALDTARGRAVLQRKKKN